MPTPQPQQPAAPETVGVVIGNHTQKYRARNPAIRWLTGRWVANLDQLFTHLTHDPGPPGPGWVGRWRSAAAKA